MTNELTMKRSNLVLPVSGYELDREEMCYVEGGANLADILWDVSLLFTAITGFIGSLGFFVKMVAKGLLIGAKILAANPMNWVGPSFVATCVSLVGLLAICFAGDGVKSAWNRLCRDVQNFSW